MINAEPINDIGKSTRDFYLWCKRERRDYHNKNAIEVFRLWGYGRNRTIKEEHPSSDGHYHRPVTEESLNTVPMLYTGEQDPYRTDGDEKNTIPLARKIICSLGDRPAEQYGIAWVYSGVTDAIKMLPTDQLAKIGGFILDAALEGAKNRMVLTVRGNAL